MILPVSARDARDTGSIPGSRRSPRGGNGNALQHSCLEDSMDRWVWWASVHGVAKSWAWLKQLSTSDDHISKKTYGNKYRLQRVRVCVCVCVRACACARARAHAQVRLRVRKRTHTHSQWCLLKNDHILGLPWKFSGLDSVLPLQGLRIQSLVGKLKSYMLCGAAK